MVLRSCLQPEMDQGPDAQRGLVAYRYAIDRVPPRRAISLSTITIPGLVIRGPPVSPGEPGPIILVIDPNENLTGAIFEGLDYEAIYILDSSIFGHGDFGRLTATVNGTWLSRAELQILPDTKRFGIAGEVYSAGIHPDQLAAMESSQFQSVLRRPG